MLRLALAYLRFEHPAAAPPPRTLAVLGFTLGIAGSVACNNDDDPADDSSQFEPHCSDMQGNQSCQDAYGGRPYCNNCVSADEYQGCVASVPPPACRVDDGTGPGSADDDVADDGSDTTTGGDSGTSGTGSDGSTAIPDGTTSESGEPVQTCGMSDGQVDPECQAVDELRPYCVGGQCSSCLDAGDHAFCGTVLPDTPACSDETGFCVPCFEAPETFTCDGGTPACSETGVCVGCAAHVDCPGTACHLDPDDPQFGQCFGQDEVVWVDADEICPGLGTQASPNCSLAQAVQGIEDGDVVVVRVDGVGAGYDEAVTISGGIVALIGTGGPDLTGEPDSDAPSLEVLGGTVYASGLSVTGNGDTHGVSCGNATLYFEASQSNGNAGYGLYTTSPCDMVVRRASVYGNTRGGIRVFGGDLRLDNAGVALNGNGVSGPGINIQQGSVEIVYSTIIDNRGQGADNIHCATARGSVRNSIVHGVSGGSIEALDCAPLFFEDNALDTSVDAASNRIVTETYDADWFVSVASGDFRLAQPSTTTWFADLAEYRPGDPARDADGTVRPTDGLGFAGVDEP